MTSSSARSSLRSRPNRSPSSPGSPGQARRGLLWPSGNGSATMQSRSSPSDPDWTSPDSLLGYEDALAAIVARRAPPLGCPRSACSSCCGPPTTRSGRICWCLDEMNLAHVERYFADVLSGMESGQGVLPDLVLEGDGQYRERTDSTGPLPLPDNLFIVGTVNVDETTYMFSPKVLDRANSFEFRVGTDDLGATGALRDLEPTSAEDAAGFLRCGANYPRAVSGRRGLRARCSQSSRTALGVRPRVRAPHLPRVDSLRPSVPGPRLRPSRGARPPGHPEGSSPAARKPTRTHRRAQSTWPLVLLSARARVATRSTRRNSNLLGLFSRRATTSCTGWRSGSATVTS